MTKRNKKAAIMLPELQDIAVKQPNRVTNAKYSYTLIQEKVFTFVIYELQEYIKRSMKGESVAQMNIFQRESDNIEVILPLKYIGRPSQYPLIRQSTEQICKVLVVLNDLEKKERSVTGLFSQVTSPEENKRSNLIRIEIKKSVAQLLMQIDYNYNHRNNISQAEEYTTFLLSVVQQSKNKYTPRIYKMISQWRKMGAFKITLEKFRARLGLNTGQYENFNDLKKRILVPVQEELKAHADIWFNVGDNDFEITDGKKVTTLNFFIISHSVVETRKKKLIILHNSIRDAFGMSGKYMELVDEVLAQCDDRKLIQVADKIRTVAERIAKDTGRVKNIPNVAAYVLKSLKEVATGG